MRLQKAIHFVSFLLFSALPKCFTRESVNPDPLERRVLRAAVQEVTA